MADEERRGKDALYGSVIREIASAVDAFPDAVLAAPEGFASFSGGIAKAWRNPENPGILLREGKYGLIAEISVAVASGATLPEVGKRLQKQISERLYAAFSLPISAINIDILKIMK